MAMTADRQLGVEAGTDPKAVIAFARDQGVKIVDFRFSDLLGQWQHFSIPVSELSESLFQEGVGFDGSSIKGFQQIYESDMLLFPDPRTAIVDPVLEVPTLSLICDVVDPVTKARYSRDPRYVAHKAEAHLRASGIADTSYWGPEMEFYIFNSIRFGQGVNEGFYHIDSDEGIWNSGRNGTPNLGFRPRLKEGYFPVPPVDKLQDLRSRITMALMEAGIDVEVH
ncbi:MAG: glutamine synthetase beta-grasp domain-containing protein, partial [Candidatus Dormibacteria bacterium]